jgi:hypothetical protein
MQSQSLWVPIRADCCYFDLDSAEREALPNGKPLSWLPDEEGGWLVQKTGSRLEI